MRNVFQMHIRETIKKETQNLSSYIETCNPIVKSKGKHNHTSYGCTASIAKCWARLLMASGRSAGICVLLSPEEYLVS